MKSIALMMLAGLLNAQQLPNPETTPGVANPAITQANIAKTICNHGHWSTKLVRPPVRYTNALKTKLMAGLHLSKPRLYELDHLIPLTVGGHPKDPRNLWVEPYEPRPGAHEKDRLEVALNSCVCSGKMTLAEGQRRISTDWPALYRELIGPFRK